MPGHLPGQRTGYTATPRNIFYARGGEIFLPGPCVLVSTATDGKNTSKTDEIRAGMVMAQVTSTGKWTPCKRTVTVAGGSGSGSGVGSTAIPVEDASAFIAGETIYVTQTAGQGLSAGAATRVIDTVDYANDIITVTVAAQYDTGAAVYGATAGTEIPRGILAETVRTLSSEPYNTTVYDKECVILSAGMVDVNYILGDYAACRAATTNYLSGILWSDRQASVS